VRLLFRHYYPQLANPGHFFNICICIIININTFRSEDDSSFRRGTRVRFIPDPEIFKSNLEFEYDRIAPRIDELAYLNPGISISLLDSRIQVIFFVFADFLHHLLNCPKNIIEVEFRWKLRKR